jgi:serine/threonine protein kinase
MKDQAEQHPSAETLRAFGLGKLEDDLAETVMEHLRTCGDCREEVAGQADDSFLERFRRAQQEASTPPPAQMFSELPRGLATTAALPQAAPLLDLPLELADNPQYEVLGTLGQGGMGVVYLARHKLSGRQEVLKVMNKEVLSRPGAKDRFLREIQTAAQLDHPNVVKMYTALELGPLLVLVMQYVPGTDLGSAVKKNGPILVTNACYYIQQAALGLQHAFEKGMVHRDIKPQNLILSQDTKKQVVHILDFGLAKATSEKDAALPAGEELSAGADAGLTGDGKMLGTPHYVAPEQIRDATKADIRSDIYSLGCTLYFLLTGKTPFKAKTLHGILSAQQLAEPKPLNLMRPDVPEELAAVARKMMAKDPAKRYQMPIEVVQALAPFIKSVLKEADVKKPAPQTAAAPPEASRSLSFGPGSVPSFEGIPETRGRETADIGKQTMIPPPLRRPIAEKESFVEPPALTQETFAEASKETTLPARSLFAEADSTKKWRIMGALCVLLVGTGVFGLWLVTVLSKHQQVLPARIEEPPKFVPPNPATTDKGREDIPPSKSKSDDQDPASGGAEGSGRSDNRAVGSIDTGAVQNKLMDGLRRGQGQGGGKGQGGVDTGEGPDPGTGKGNLSVRQKRLLRWTMKFNTKTGQDYRQQLLALGAILAIPQPEGGYMVIRDLRTTPATGRIEDINKLNRIFWIDDKPESVAPLAQALGIRPIPPHIVAFFPVELEQELLRRELAYRNGSEDDILETKFEVRRDNLYGNPYGGAVLEYVPEVIEQKVKTSADAESSKDRSVTPLVPQAQTDAAAKAKAGPGSGSAAEDKGFVPLFNGNNLDGWKMDPRAASWRVDTVWSRSSSGTGSTWSANGVLIGSRSGDGLLWTDRNDYADFQLRVQARIDHGGYALVILRDEERKHRGLEVVINSTNRNPYKTGSLLYGSGQALRAADKSPPPPGEWFRLDVTVRGTHVIIKVDDNPTVDYNQPDLSHYSRGGITLFAAIKEVEFRKIEIKELPPPKGENAPATGTDKGARPEDTSKDKGLTRSEAPAQTEPAAVGSETPPARKEPPREEEELPNTSKPKKVLHIDQLEPAGRSSVTAPVTQPAQPTALQAKANAAENAEVRELYRALAYPHDVIFWGRGQMWRVAPLKKAVGEEPEHLQRYDSDWNLYRSTIGISGKEITAVKYYEQIALERVDEFLKEPDRLQESKSKLTPLARLRAADDALAAVLDFSKAFQRKGRTSEDLGKALDKRLRDVRAEELIWGPKAPSGR